MTRNPDGWCGRQTEHVRHIQSIGVAAPGGRGRPSLPCLPVSYRSAVRPGRKVWTPNPWANAVRSLTRFSGHVQCGDHAAVAAAV